MRNELFVSDERNNWRSWVRDLAGAAVLVITILGSAVSCHGDLARRLDRLEVQSTTDREHVRAQLHAIESKVTALTMRD